MPKLANVVRKMVVFGWFLNDLVWRPTSNVSDLVGNPMGVAYNPLAGSSIVSPMNFVNPIINFLGLTAITIVSNAMAFFVFE